MKEKALIIQVLNSRKKVNFCNMPIFDVRQNYAEAVIKSGGDILFVPHYESLTERILSIADGVIFPGADFDIDPALYGEESKYPNLETNPERTNFELQLITKILNKGIPFLGICGGMQLLNVALGGSLYQHIPDEIENYLPHSRDHKGEAVYHEIFLHKDTKLYEIGGGITQTTETNSAHHQAVKRLGSDLQVSAIASDGVIEAVELKDYPFCIGVEWHPEYLYSELDKRLYKSLIEHAILYRENKNNVYTKSHF